MALHGLFYGRFYLYFTYLQYITQQQWQFIDKSNIRNSYIKDPIPTSSVTTENWTQGHRTILCLRHVGWDSIICMALTTGWIVWGSNPSKCKLSAPVQTSPKAHPASYIMCTGPVPEVRWLEHGVNHRPHLAPRWKKEYSCTSTPVCLHGRLEGFIFMPQEQTGEVFTWIMNQHSFGTTHLALLRVFETGSCYTAIVHINK
jgi:hypothetical protein